MEHHGLGGGYGPPHFQEEKIFLVVGEVVFNPPKQLLPETDRGLSEKPRLNNGGEGVTGDVGVEFMSIQGGGKRVRVNKNKNIEFCIF